MDNSVSLVAVIKNEKHSSMKRNKLIANIIVYTLLCVGAFTMIYPLVWMLSVSFSASASAYLNVTFFPIGFKPLNYKTILSSLGGSYGPGYFRSLLNTLLYAILPTVVSAFVSAMAAFAFAKIEFFGRNFIFLFLLSAIMIPFPAIMMEQYWLYAKIFDWVNGPLVMLIPRFFGNIMTIFFVRQYLLGLPSSIVESAKIDGASYPRIFFTMILPNAGPAIFAHGLLGFIGTWNDYLAPLIFVRSKAWYPMVVALANYNASLHVDFQVAMAGAVLAVMPILILFGIFQKTIIQSVMMSGSKE